MQVTVDDAGTLRKQVTILYQPDEVQRREEELLGRYASQVKLKGFRPGKTPKQVVRKRYGAAVASEVRDALANEGLQQALREHQLQPIGPIATEEQNADNGLKVVTSFDVRPPVAVPEPDSVELPREDVGATDAEVDEELATISRRAGEQVDLPEGEGLAADDVVTLTGRVSAGDETIREVHDLHHIVGAYPLFGLEPAKVVELLGGKKVGEAIAFDTTLPERFTPEAWAGKEAHVSLTAQSAQRLKPATLDDELAKRLGAEGLDDLKARIRQVVERRKGDALRDRQREALLEQLVARTDFPLPPKLFESALQQRLEEAAHQAVHDEVCAREPGGHDHGAHHHDPEAVAKKREELEPRVREDTERMLRRMLVLDAIAAKYDVACTNEDLSQQIAMAAYRSGRPAKEIAQQLQQSGRLGEVAADIRQHKALEVFLDKALGAPAGEARA